MRKPYPEILLILALASLGYAAGLRMGPGNETLRPRSDGSGESGATRPSRTVEAAQATFAGMQPRLRELAAKRPAGSDPRLFTGGVRPGQYELELESIFALATRDELIDWFANEASEEAEAATLTAAYSRLATLSLEEAVEIWADRFRRSGKHEGVEGLVRAWAAADPSGAEAWVLRLDDPQARNAALFALLYALAETSPDFVERHLFEFEIEDERRDLFRSIHLATRLARNAPLQGLSRLADRVLEERQGRWESQNQLSALLEVWGERDGPAMMRWLLDQAPGSIRSHVIPRAVEARAKADPAAFLREIGPSLHENEALGGIAGQAWLKWLATDKAEEALVWFAGHGERLGINEEWVWIDHSWSSEQLNRALSGLARIPEGEIKTEASRAILQHLSWTDPKSMLSWAGELPPGHDTDGLIASTLSNLARSGDPAGALDWALANLGAGQGKNDAVRFVMSSWAETNPVAAAEEAGNLPERLRAEAHRGIAYAWAARSPEQVLDYLAKAPDPTAVSSLASHAFWGIGHDLGGERYLPRALALPDEAMRLQAVEGLFGGWSRANLETSAEALEGLERGPLRDAAVAAFVSNASRTDREAALVWALDIGEAAKRREVAMQQARYWLNADRAAATRWIEASETLPEEWKAELLKPRE